MKKFNSACSMASVIIIAVFLITLSQNLVVRTSELYSFYFNDSQAVSYVYTELSENEIADEIVAFMNSWNPEEFQIYENTGYDLQGIFDENDGYNMMCIKRAVDMSAVLCIVSLILVTAIYFYLIKCEEKKKLRTAFRIAFIITVLASAAEIIILATSAGRAWLAEIFKLRALGEESVLATLLGADFLSMAVIFFAIISAVVLAVAAYVNYRLTKPPRIFYR